MKQKIFSISDLQIPIHFLLSFLMSHKNEVLVIWPAVNNMKSQQKLLFFYYVKKILSYQKHKTPKTDDVVDKPGTFFSWDQKRR